MLKNTSYKSSNSEAYNKLFNLPELIDSIRIFHSTAIGPDKIHYEFLKQLPKEYSL